MRPPNSGARNGLGRRTLLAALAGAAVVRTDLARADEALIRIGYIRSTDRHPTISLLDQPTQDDGLAGAKLAIDDNNTTGSFMGQKFELIDVRVHADADLGAALAKATDEGARFVLTDLPAADVLKLSDAAHASGAVILNIAAPDVSLREQDCRANVIHVAPSRDMLADAVGQYLVWKKWTRWLLVSGSHPDDMLLADAYRR
ncbi:MAG: ABC transporter substrate-binding protein, partial [Acetobacteraceae bacterium]